MSDLVPADANHIMRAFVLALTQQHEADRLDVAIDSIAAHIAERILGILGANGLMIMQIVDILDQDAVQAA